VTVTNPKGWTTTTYDQERGLATRVSDVNQQVTTEVTESDAAYWDSTASAYTARTGLPLSTGYGNDAGLGAETVGFAYNLADTLTGFGTTSSTYLDDGAPARR
jgi:hypothetical protein